MNNSKRITIRLSDELDEALAALVKQDGHTTKAAMLRKIANDRFMLLPAIDHRLERFSHNITTRLAAQENIIGGHTLAVERLTETLENLMAHLEVEGEYDEQIEPGRPLNSNVVNNVNTGGTGAQKSLEWRGDPAARKDR